MYEPLTTSTVVVAGSAGVTFATLFPEATPPVMICALAGALLYVLTSENHQIWKQIVFAVISFIGGVYSAEFVSHILTALANTVLQNPNPPVSIPPAVGALVGAVIAVTVLLRILSRSKTFSLGDLLGLIKARLKGGRND
jgi:Na+/glutamate symporter